MVFIVAECGVNWDGDWEYAKEMISQAKKVGADAVKFQTFLPEHVEGHPEAPRLLSSSLFYDTAKPLKAYAEDEVGIEFFVTPFYEKAIDWLETLGVNRYKIREKDARIMTEQPGYVPPLVEKALATGKELFISVQRKPIDNWLFWHPQIKWLYCLPLYPPRLEEIEFWHCRSMDGYSNHYPHIIAPLTAAILGAKIIEVHVTLSHNMDVPDKAVSLDFAELNQLVEYVRMVEKENLELSRELPVF